MLGKQEFSEIEVLKKDCLHLLSNKGEMPLSQVDLVKRSVMSNHERSPSGGVWNVRQAETGMN